MLLIGPAGSGKTARVLGELEAALGRGEPARLIVPTASMAEHLQHQMARGGLVVSPRTILPLAAFVAHLTPDCRELSPALEILLVERALARAAAGEFAAMAGYPGFHARLLDTMHEFWAAGAQTEQLKSILREPPAGAFARVMAEFEALLREAGAVHRAARLRLAADAAQKEKFGAVFVDGFFNFTPVELELLRAVAGAAEKIVVTLPDSGADEARRALLEMGMPEQRLAHSQRPRLAPVIVQAATPEREIEHVAGRILADHQQTGRPFQEYGIILRAPEVYGPIVDTVFERLGIPFRSRWPLPLDGHPSIRFLAGLLKLADTGFDGEETLEVLKLAGSGIGFSSEMDRYEFRLRAALPGQGLEFLHVQAANLARVEAKLHQLGKLAAWAGETLPPDTWAQRAAELARAWFHPPKIEDSVSHEKALAWRRLAQALQAWAGAAEDAAEALRLEGVERASLQRFRAALEAVLRLTLLRAPDRRRNVVQVLSVYEARQWELPVVFVCGLVEKQFPRYHSQNLFFPDAPRRRLAGSGLRLRTSADLDREERFLFDLATTRATEQLYLTYPAHDDAGAETLRSFFLEEWKDRVVAAERVRVKEPPPDWRPAPGCLRDPDLLRELVPKEEPFSPSSLEQYIQCPFQFFAARTLDLKGPPVRPDERIDERVKGDIIHRTIARWTTQGGDIAPVFAQAFEEACATGGIRINLQAEAMRIELLRDLERFAKDQSARGLAVGFRPGQPESRFLYVVEEAGEEPFRVTGRIDRYEVSDSGAAVVVDYKYSSPARVQKLVEEHQQGFRLQGPLYLLGLERQMGHVPAGMVFYGLRGEASRRGWYVSGLGFGDPVLLEQSPQEFRVMLDRAAASTLELVGRIRRGRVEVAPRDRQVCREFCPYRPVCRVDL
ncbi:MAG TPA: PD-(D/E)XK nuclease family protein [Bryobacterales bacterium]|nr:PD-(D/E)XK nuclease family protein [Bryobacterales bacterium]